MEYKKNNSQCLFLFVCLAFVIRVFFWASSDISHDEALSLGMYCYDLDGKSPGFFAIFRNYTLANNHFLSSATYWLWLKILPFRSNSFLVRLPSLLFAISTLWFISFKWRKYLGEYYSFVASLVFATSFIYNSFSYQARGYSLSMFLSTCLVYCILEIVHSATKKGQFMLCFLLFLQPLIMPSAAIISVATSMILFTYCYFTERNFSKAVKIAMPGLLCSMLSASYYLTLGEQLRIAAANAGKGASLLWTRYSALGNVFLAFTLHTGILLIPLCVLLYTNTKKAFAEEKSDDATKRKTLVIFLFLFVSIILISIMYLFAPPSKLPYPRNSLVFLPFVSFAVILAAAETNFLYKEQKLLLSLILLFNFGIEYYYRQRTLTLVEAGKKPISLTMQLYRSANDFSKISKIFKELPIKKDTLIFTQNYDLATMLWHTAAYNLPTENLHSPNTIKNQLFSGYQKNQNVIIIAQTEKQVEDFLEMLQLSKERVRLQGNFSRRKLYVWQ